MKRRLCIAMILALFSTCVYTPSLAEAVEDICAPVEEQVAPAEQAGDTGLFVEEEVPQTAEAPVEAAVEAPAQSFSTPLARVLPECILVYQNVDSTQPIVALGAGSGSEAVPGGPGPGGGLHPVRHGGGLHRSRVACRADRG